jgi:Xaa-Pro dipeptidase
MARKDTPSQRRALFAERLKKANIGAAVVSNPKHIFYLTGIPTNLDPYHAAGKGQRSTSFLVVGDDGDHSFLLGSSEAPLLSSDPGADKVALYDDYDLDVTMVSYGDTVAAEMKKWLRSFLAARRSTRRVGIEEWHLAQIYAEAVERATKGKRLTGISSVLMRMRETKGKDEMEKIRAATKIIDYAFGFAKASITPGMTEYALFAEMNRACMEKFGEAGIIGGDVVSGERTLKLLSTPTQRKLRRGDTVILDMQTTSDSYWSDTARTFVVGSPSVKQRELVKTLMDIKQEVAKMLKPGTPTKDLADTADALLKKKGHSNMLHHLGHAVGLDDQERPWLIRGSDDMVRLNQAFVIEPGVYEKATGGMRIEDCYFVTTGGVERVSRFPLEL